MIVLQIFVGVIPVGDDAVAVCGWASQTYPPVKHQSLPKCIQLKINTLQKVMGERQWDLLLENKLLVIKQTKKDSRDSKVVVGDGVGFSSW